MDVPVAVLGLASMLAIYWITRSPRIVGFVYLGLLLGWWVGFMCGWW